MKVRPQEVLLLTSAIGVGIVILLERFNVSKACLYGLIDSDCNAFLYLTESLLFISFPILFLSLLAYLWNVSVVSSWRLFTYRYLFLFLLIVITFPESSGGGGWISGGGVTKATYGLLLSALYFIISVPLIITKAFKMRKK